MARWRLAHSKGVLRFICLMASVSAALGAGTAMAEDRQTARSFPVRYQEATKSAEDLVWDIYEYAECVDLDFVEEDVVESKHTLKRLIAEADRTGQDVAADALRFTLAALTDTFDDYKAYCGKHLLRIRPYFKAGLVSQVVTGNVQRLAHDVGGTIRYDFGNVDQKSSGSKFQLGLDMPVQRIGSFTYSLSMAYAYASLTSSASGSANGPFNAPGLGVGPFGNGFATGANTPVSFQYDSDSNRHLFDLSAIARTRLGSVYFSPRIGGNFGVYTVDDSYTFNRPSPPSTFTGSYTTNSTAYTVGGYFQMGLDYRLPQSNVTVFGAAKAGFDYNWAKSDVSFQVTSPLSDYQKVSISDTKFTPNLSLESGIKFNLGAWDGYLKGGIQYGHYVPNVSIPGGGLLPKLNGETATEYSVMAGLRMDLSQFDKAPRRQIYFSDTRLKRDIAQVSRLANGLKLYRYRYLWSDTVYVGVMAQEVALLMPRAVLRGPDGFLRVDYDRLGIRMMTWDEWLATGVCAKLPVANSNCRLEDEAG